MSDRTLFSRRQILSLFGGATGAAIVGVNGQTSNTANGNLTAGTDNMPAPYQVGEATYKGPQSVRSEVPQEDGTTFIVTDAGSNNDQFAIEHYNSGWARQGMNTTSLDTGEQNNSVYWATEDEYPRWSDVQSLADSVPVGATIMLEARQYPFDFLGNNENAVSIDTDNVTLAGQGYASEIFLENDTTNTDEGADILETSGKAITLRDFRINGNYQNNSAGETGTTQDGHNLTVAGDKTHVYGIWSENSTGDGIEMFGDSQLVWGSHFNDNWEHGVGLNGCTNSLVYGCEMDTEVNSAIIGCFSGSANEGNVIDNCILRNAQDTAIAIRPDNNPLRDFTVSNTKIFGANGSAAIVITDGSNSPEVDNVKLKDVEIYDPAAWGVRVGDASNVTIERCHIEGAGLEAINANIEESGLEMRNNDIIDPNQDDADNNDAIKINAGVSVDRVRITDNHIYTKASTSRRPRNGILLEGSGSIGNDSKVRDNHIESAKNINVNPLVTFNGELVRNGAGVLENAQTVTKSADGSTTDFNLDHGCGIAPDSYSVTPTSADAAGSFYVDSVDASTVNIIYSSAPASGTDNLTWKVTARVDNNN